MKKILKLVLLTSLFLCSFSGLAQSSVDDYLNAERLRIQKADSIEVKISEFISNNFTSYNLTQSFIDNIISEFGLGDEEILGYELNESELNELLATYKKMELRKLYFLQNPYNESLFVATERSEELQLSCINGGFEQNGMTMGAIPGYTFKRKLVFPASALDSACDIGKATDNFVPTQLNQFNYTGPPLGLGFQGNASRVDSGNEPLLAALNPPILINRVNPTGGGNFSLKINPTPLNPPTPPNQNNQITYADGHRGDLTEVRTSAFIIDQNAIQFNFLLIGKIVPNDIHMQPVFSYRLLDATTNAVLRKVCILMSANDCRFVTVDDTRSGWQNTNMYGRLIYTPQWVCESINTADLMNRRVRLEFSVSDCERRGHFATVYIDNLCGTTCDRTWGSISIAPASIHCPIAPFQICGSYQLPDSNTVINSITLKILDQSGALVTTVTNPVITGQNYCFTLNPLQFGTSPTGNFYFEVNTVLSNTLGCINSGTLTATGAEVSFLECCQPILSSAQNITTIVHAERSDWIRSQDIITFGNGVFGDGVVYHAKNFVEMLPGFDAVYGSQYSAYPEGCTIPQEFSYRTQENIISQAPKELPKINLVKVINNILIYPNPSNKWLTIKSSKVNIVKMSINSIEGRQVFAQTSNSQLIEIDLSNISNGVYLITVETNDGKVTTKKFLKN